MDTLIVAAASALVLLSPFVFAFASFSHSAAERVATGEALYTLRSGDLPCAD